MTVGAPKTKASPNIYYSQQGSLVDATGLITAEVMSPQVQQKLSAEGFTASYQAQVLNTGTSETPAYSVPEMDLCTSSYSSELSAGTAGAVIGGSAGCCALARWHRTSRRGTFSPIRRSWGAGGGRAGSRGWLLQAYLGVGVMGFIITAASALWADQSVGRRARRAAGSGGRHRRPAGRAAARLEERIGASGLPAASSRPMTPAGGAAR